MTGSRNKYTVGLAVALAAVMVLSMLGMGFVGSAAAVTGEVDDGTGGALIASNPADSDAGSSQDVEHVITIEIDDTDDVVNEPFATEDDDSSIVIEYSDDTEDNPVGSDGAVTVDYFDSAEEELKTDLDKTATDENDGTQVNISELNEFENEFENTLSGGDLIRIYVDDGYELDNSEVGDVSITVETTEQSVELTEEADEVDFPLGDDAGIEVSGASEEHYTSFEQAVDAADTEDANEVELDADQDEFKEVFTQPVGLDSGDPLETADYTDGDETFTVTVNEGEPPVEVVSSADTLLDIDHDDITVEDVEFTGATVIDEATDPAETAVDVSDENEDLTIENNVFNDFTDSVVDVGALASDLTVEENEFNAETTTGDYTAVEITDVNGDGEEVDLIDNEVNDVSDPDSVIDLTVGEHNPTVTIEEDEYNLGEDASGTDVVDVTANDGTELDVELDGVDIFADDDGEDEAGVALTTDADSDQDIDITVGTEEAGVEFENLGGQAIDLSDVDDESTQKDVSVTLDGADDELDITNVGTAVDVSGLDADGNKVDLDIEVEDVTVSGGDNGILFEDEDGLNSFTLTLDDEDDSASEFSNLDETAVAIEGETDDNIDLAASEPEFEDTQFTNVGSGVVIDTDTALEQDGIEFDDSVAISLEDSSGEHAIKFNPGDDEALTVTDVDIDGDSTVGDDTAILFESDNTLTLDYDGESIDTVGTGVDIQEADQIDDESIEDLAFTGIADTALNINSDLGSEHTIDNVEVTDSQDAVGINIETADEPFVVGGEEQVTLGDTGSVDTGITMATAGGSDDLTIDDVDITLADASGDGINYEGEGVLTLADEDLTISGVSTGDQTAINVDSSDADLTVEEDVDTGLEVSNVKSGLVIDDLGANGFTGTGEFDRNLQFSDDAFTGMGDGAAVEVGADASDILTDDISAQDALVVINLDVESEAGETTAVEFDDESTGLAVINSEFTDVETGVGVVAVDDALEGVDGAVLGGIETDLDGDGAGVEAGDSTALVAAGSDLETDEDDPLTVEVVDTVDSVTEDGGTLSVVGSGEGTGVEVTGGAFDFEDQTASTQIDNVDVGVEASDDGSFADNEIESLTLSDIGDRGLSVDDTGGSAEDLTVSEFTMDAAGGDSPTGILFEPGSNSDDLELAGDIDIGTDERVGSGIVVDDQNNNDAGELEFASDADVDIQLQDTGAGIEYSVDNAADDVTFDGDAEIEIDGDDHAEYGILIDGDTETDIELEDASDSIEISGVDNGLVLADGAGDALDSEAELDGLDLSDIGAGAAIEISGDIVHSSVTISEPDGAIDFTEDADANDAVGINIEDGSIDEEVIIDNVDIDGPSSDSDATGVSVDADSADITFDDGTNEPSTIEDVATGLSIENADTLNDGAENDETVEETTFLDIGDTAVDIDEPGLDSGGTSQEALSFSGLTVGDDGDSSDATAVSFEDSVDLTVSDSDLGTADEPIEVGVDVDKADGSSDEVVVDSDTTVTLADSSEAVGIDASELSASESVEIDGTTIEAASEADDAVGITVDTNGDFDLATSEAVTIAAVGDGVEVDGVNQFQSEGSTATLDEVTFDGIADTALDIEVDSDTDTLELDGVTVEAGTDTTVVEFDDDSTNLEVTDTDLDTAVENYVLVDDVDDSLTVNGLEEDDTLELDGGFGVDASPESDQGDDVIIKNIERIEGSGDATALRFDFDDNSDANLDVSDLETIDDVAVGIEIQDIGAETSVDLTNDLLEQGEITDYQDDALIIKDDEIDTITIEDSTFTEAAEADDATAVSVEESSDADVEIKRTTFDGEAEDGTAISLDDIGSSSHEIRFNDIEGFDVGLTGDDITELDEEDAVANYWGSELGPQSEAGSDVTVDLSDPTEAAIYDPYLTADTDAQVERASDVDTLDELETDDVVLFGQDLDVSHLDTFAFPATPDSEVLADAVDFDDIDTDEESDMDDIDGAKIWEYEDGEYQLVDADEDRPDGMDAYRAAFEDTGDSTIVNIDYADSIASPDSHQYESGFNLVPVATFTEDLGTSSGSETDVSQANTFGYADFKIDQDGVELTGVPEADGGIHEHAGTELTNVDAESVEAEEPTLSPYHGVWVYVSAEETAETNQQPVDEGITLQDILDGQLENPDNS